MRMRPHLYEMVSPLVGLSVRPSVALFPNTMHNTMQNTTLLILDASLQLYLCPSVCLSVNWSIGSVVR